MGVLDGRAVEWHMAHGPKGRVWIDRISYQDSEISNYGINSEILDSGILTNKPLEYDSQAWMLKDLEVEGATPALREFEHSKNTGLDKYADITGFLDQLAPISSYRKAKGIRRQKLERSSSP